MGIQETLVERYDDADLLFMDGYDTAICGVVSRAGQDDIVCYDLDKVIEISMHMGMSEDSAYEHFYFNQVGAWVGDKTPCFLQRIDNA